jgi:hypothetical protein
MRSSTTYNNPGSFVVPNTIFNRLARTRPAPPPEEKAKVDPAQKLLTWLQRRNKPTVRMNEILVYGPRPEMRKRENAISATETLVRYGWLRPLKTRRPNMLEWQIVRDQPL